MRVAWEEFVHLREEVVKQAQSRFCAGKQLVALEVAWLHSRMLVIERS